MAFTIAALTLVAVVALWFTFRYYPEKRAAEHFLMRWSRATWLRRINFGSRARAITMNDFLADWGAQGYYGPVKSYVIEREENTARVHGALRSL